MNPTPEEFAREMVTRLRNAGYIAYWAGGCVRDLLLGKTPKDYDVATNATPDQVREVFGKRRTLTVGASFGVVIVLGPTRETQVEVATFRSDGDYEDGRRPTQVCFSTPELDAQRRDFTINGMFYDPVEAEVIDYVGGLADLKAQLLRAIGDPLARMTEDKLRLLRAVRFTATLGFQLEAETAAAVARMAPQLRVVSAERITQELDRMLKHPQRRRAIELSHELGLLSEIFPDLIPHLDEWKLAPTQAPWQQTLELLAGIPPGRFELALAILLESIPGCIPEICKQRRLSNRQAELVTWLADSLPLLSQLGTMRLSRLKRLLAHPDIEELLLYFEAKTNLTGDYWEGFQNVKRYWQETPREIVDPEPLMTGADLIREGLTPGPRFKEILETLRDAQLEGEIDTRESGIALLRQLISSRE